MAKMLTKKDLMQSDMMLLISYVVLYVVDVLVLWLANMLFPSMIVLGTHSLTPMWALYMSMTQLALIGTFAIPVAHLIEKYRGKILSSMEWMVGYFFLNFGAFWLITRFSEQFGVGITAWYWAAILALVWDVAQGMVMMMLEKMRTS